MTDLFEVVAQLGGHSHCELTKGDIATLLRAFDHKQVFWLQEKQLEWLVNECSAFLEWCTRECEVPLTIQFNETGSRLLWGYFSFKAADVEALRFVARFCLEQGFVACVTHVKSPGGDSALLGTGKPGEGGEVPLETVFSFPLAGDPMVKEIVNGPHGAVVAG